MAAHALPAAPSFPRSSTPNSEGRSVSGGIVYRGEDLPDPDGTYFYGDFVSGWVRSFRFSGLVSRHWGWEEVLDQTSLISSFDVDVDGETYIVGLDGNVWRLTGRSSRQLVGDFDGNGDTEIALRRSGHWIIAADRAPTGGGFQNWTGSSYGRGWTTQAVGDFDRDGRDDIAQFRPSNGTWWISRSTGSGFTTTLWADLTTASGWDPQAAADSTETDAAP